MAISFPTSPTVGQTYTYNNRTWIWNGSGWAIQQTTLNAIEIATGLGYIPFSENGGRINTLGQSGETVIYGNNVTTPNLYTANHFFESTQNNYIQYNGSNAYSFIAGGANVGYANSSSFNFGNTVSNNVVSNTIIANSYIISNGYITANSYMSVGNTTVNTSANGLMFHAHMGYTNEKTFGLGSYSTNASLNMVIVGPYTIATGNTFVVTTGSRVVIV